MPEYPFIPRSTAPLEPGQFWAFALKNGRFAAGCVLAKLIIGGRVDSRLFLAGLLNWSGNDTPRCEILTDIGLLDMGVAHIKAITENGGHIHGVVHVKDLPHSPVLKTDEFPTWGYGVVRVLAEKHFGMVS
jgi:hypothetical protein